MIKIFIIFLSLIVPAISRACEINAPPEVRISGEYKSGRLTSVVLAHAKAIRFFGRSDDKIRAWDAEFKISRTLYGKNKTGSVLAYRTGRPDACDDGIDAPKIGDEWVLYLVELNHGYAVLSYPLEISLKFDKRLAGIFSKKH